MQSSIPQFPTLPDAGPVPAGHRAESLRVLGSLAAGMAHDLRNVLNGIFLRVQLLERADLQAIPDAAENVAQLHKDVLVGAELLERVRTFARNDVANPTSVDLNDVVSEACALAKLGALSQGSSPTTLTREPGSVRLVAGHRGELVSAVLNLLLNSAEAMRGGGHVTARTGATDTSSWIEIEDDGPGIPEEIEARMFDPFFTTKGSTGTGLGLASVADCMRRHAGSIHVRTAPGRGTSIALVFPGASR